MRRHELHNGRLAVEVRQDGTKMIMTFDHGDKCVLILSLEEVRDLKEALQRMEEEMLSREEEEDPAPTPEEWTSWQLNKLRIYTQNIQTYEFVQYELKSDLDGLEVICRHVPTTPMAHHHIEVAKYNLKEAIKTLDSGIRENRDVMEALEHIIITRDMSEGAFERELNCIRRGRRGNEPQ